MGAKDSKRCCLSYEDAVRRITDAELKRITEAYKRVTAGSSALQRPVFMHAVLGDGVPQPIAEKLYEVLGGGVRGITLRDLICGLVLLTKGTRDERIRFLWLVYSNDAGMYITRADFNAAMLLEGGAAIGGGNSTALFDTGQDKCTYEQFRTWLAHDRNATVLSRWLLGEPCVSLSSELDAPTFYQSLAGVTHLEASDIGALEKCFWALQAAAPSGEVDLQCVSALVSPPMPGSVCAGLFLALDVNRDGHVDFKELCCGISAACRGPTAERMKFCFKIFDTDRDQLLNRDEFEHMLDVLRFVACDDDDPNDDEDEENDDDDDKLVAAMAALRARFDDGCALAQEDFVMWCVEHPTMVAPLLELLFQIGHVSLGLRPNCRHHEHEIVMGWLAREERRGYRIGQFWYLIGADWWHAWLAYVTAARHTHDSCTCRPPSLLQHQQASAQGHLQQQQQPPIEEGIVCDESFTSNSTSTDSISGEFLLRPSGGGTGGGGAAIGGDSCSIASSSGVSSNGSGSSNSVIRRPPGPIDNASLVEVPQDGGGGRVIGTLTGEGGRLKRDTPLVQHRDFILVPDSLWKALALWHGGPLPLPRQVIASTEDIANNAVELELYPLQLKIHRHQQSTTTAAAQLPARRFLAHTATFSRQANVRQVVEFLAVRLALRVEDVRLWLLGGKDGGDQVLLDEDDASTLQQLGVGDNASVLLEVRNKDLTWPEELGALVASGGGGSGSGGVNTERRMTITLPPGATGLHNLGNTCFMNAALQAVSNTRPLTQYFQLSSPLAELNATNPLGTKGQVARRYAELCRELWTGATRSVAPLKLRWCVTKHAPHLGGGGQHDSQELLAWLLDALHEDLNRSAAGGKPKAYRELGDSDGRADELVADEAWREFLARDCSIITDLFYGQLKSKVTCETCGHESVRFDAFNLLSLPLPMESYTLCEILLIRQDGTIPIKYGVRLNSEAKYDELKRELATLCDIPPARLLIAEVGAAQIRCVRADSERVHAATACELFAYEVPSSLNEITTNDDNDSDETMTTTTTTGVQELQDIVTSLPPQTLPSTTTINTNTGSAVTTHLAMVRGPPENARTNSIDLSATARRFSNGLLHHAAAMATSKQRHLPHSNHIYTDIPVRQPSYLVAVHRKCVRQETYFLSQHKTKPSLFGVPLLIGCAPTTTCQTMYESVWRQVTRLLSPLPACSGDQTNHATDCDDSLGYEFPFTLRAVLPGGQICALCHWTQFCRGCKLPCDESALVFDVLCGGVSGVGIGTMCIAIDWDPTALHLRYQSCREKLWREHASVPACRKLHTEPIDLHHCLTAFTTEERLEARYHCSSCHSKQPATKKLQIWRLPPILIVHLKRFDYCNAKWVKTQKAVEFPYRDFDPTEYLAAVPQETILRHRHLASKVGTSTTRRKRLESTSLLRTPIDDAQLVDFHQHKLLDGEDALDLKYQLYAVVSHSGMLNGGHYISYACNPNGNWYCYNDSSCREIVASNTTTNQQEEKPDEKTSEPKIDTSAAYILFYERAGLDYRPYMPAGGTSGGGSGSSTAGGPPSPLVDDELDESESELRRQLCTLQ